MNPRLLVAAVALLLLSACSPQTESKDPVVRGERYFKGLGCVQCHKVGDVGHEWGPNLTLIGFRKSPEWLDTWLKNPHQWNPKTVMPSFNLNDATRADLVAYLAAQKGQAWKEYPWRTEQALSLAPAERGRLIFERAGCSGCHGKDGAGGYPNNNVAGGLIPALTAVTDGYNKKELAERINHGAVPIPADMKAPKPLLEMPKWGQMLKPDEIDAVVEYLFSLKPKGPPSPDDF